MGQRVERQSCLADSDVAAVLYKAHASGLDPRPKTGWRRSCLVLLAVDRQSELLVLLVDRSGMGRHCIGPARRHRGTKAARPTSDHRAGRCLEPPRPLPGNYPAWMRAHRRLPLHASLSDCSHCIPKKDQSSRGSNHGSAGSADGGESGNRRSRATFRGGAEQDDRHALALRPMPEPYGPIFLAVLHLRRRVAPVAARTSVDDAVVGTSLGRLRAAL